MKQLPGSPSPFTILTVASVLMALLSLPLWGQNVELPRGPFAIAPNDNSACLKCHGMAGFAFRDSASATARDLSVRAAGFRESVHGELHCQQCHGNITSFPHLAASRAKVTCADACHATDSSGKVYSHRMVVAEFTSSVHGRSAARGNRDVPDCLTCHGNRNPHEIGRGSKEMSPKEKMALCGNCHDDAAKMARNHVTAEGVRSYRRSFHYKAIRFGETNTAVCQDCHTAHGVLPADRSRSSICPWSSPWRWAAFHGRRHRESRCGAVAAPARRSLPQTFRGPAARATVTPELR